VRWASQVWHPWRLISSVATA